MRLIDALASFATGLLLVADPQANHQITLYNNCSHAINLRLSNWPSHPPYRGPPIGSFPSKSSKSSKSVTVPSGWEGHICEATGGYGGGDCYGVPQ